MVSTRGWVPKQLLCLIFAVVSPWLSGALSLQSVMKKFSIHLIWAFVQVMKSRVRMSFFLQCGCMLTGSSDWLVCSSKWWLHVWCLQHSSASALAVLGRLMITSPSVAMLVGYCVLQWRLFWSWYVMLNAVQMASMESLHWAQLCQVWPFLLLWVFLDDHLGLLHVDVELCICD